MAEQAQPNQASNGDPVASDEHVRQVKADLRRWADLHESAPRRRTRAVGDRELAAGLDALAGELEQRGRTGEQRLRAAEHRAAVPSRRPHLPGGAEIQRAGELRIELPVETPLGADGVA